MTISPLPELSGHAGAAFLLDRPADISVTIEHPEGIVVVRKGAGYVTVALNATYGNSSLSKTHTWRVVQESFDVLAARTRKALSTSLGDREYILWNLEDEGYHLTCVETAEFSLSMSIQIITPEVSTTPQVIPFTHHPSLRFYRLSQLSDDLFDAYRNAYLAFEYLISGESERRSESEIKWFKRVISESFPDVASPDIIDEIYKDGRLPLFHAKFNQNFYAPYGSDREKVQELFEKLAQLLVKLLQKKLGYDSVCDWGFSSQDTIDAMGRALFNFDEFLLMHEEKTVSVFPTVEIVEESTRFGTLWARATTNCPSEMPYLSYLNLQSGGKPWLQLHFTESIPLNLVKTFTLEIGMLHYHVGAPKPVHPK